MRELLAAVTCSLSIALVSCGGGGGGEDDTSIDTTLDVTDTSGDTGDAPVDTAGDDAVGEEECASDGDCDDSDPCTADTCDTDYGTCDHQAVDADGDGYAATEVGGTECAGGTDCDDGDEDVHPDAAPDCTGTVDMNCTGADDRDEDGDGYTTVACSGGDDCDDSDDTAFPGSLAVDCTTVDHDCNGEEDSDNDGDGQESSTCGGNDCDDGDAGVRWGIAEVDCDGVDTNCDGTLSVVEDADADDSPNAACAPAGVEPDCNDGDYDIRPGATEVCDSVDDDCDGEWDDAVGSDDDLDGYLDETCGGTDCDDEDATNHPGADNDGDGYVDARCGGDDCDDGNEDAYPGAPELCTDGIDEDCDGTLDCHGYEECSTSGRCEIVWVTVSAGMFTMGSPTSEPGRETYETEHQVTLTGSFEIQVIEVTQDQFFALMGYQIACNTSCGGGCPVECVTWHEAAAYCNALSTAAGYGHCYTCTGSGTGVTCSPSMAYATPYDCPGYRLPTEAEWEYATRAGTTTGTYNGTSTLTDCTMPNTVLDPIAWFCGNSGSTIHEVGGKLPNTWELYDMLGNVFEWCGDWYDTYPGTISDPWGPASGSIRVMRGGSWNGDAWFARAAYRNGDVPGVGYDGLGFRPARSL